MYAAAAAAVSGLRRSAGRSAGRLSYLVPARPWPVQHLTSFLSPLRALTGCKPGASSQLCRRGFDVQGNPTHHINSHLCLDAAVR
jgi:hypothetical protein